jgi:Tfp pilus assembly protein PilX
MKTHAKNFCRNQVGAVSLMFSLVSMIVISLLVLGLTSISVRGQGASLDEQLSTQAFYAAETGVNDASQVVKTAVANGQTIPAKTDCQNSGHTNYPQGPVWLNATDTVGYTCLLVNPTPLSLQYDIPDGSNVVAPISASSPYDSIEVSWTPVSTTNPLSGCPKSGSNNFVPQSQWTCQYAALRVDLTPTTGPLTRSGLVNSTLSSVFEPYQGLDEGDNQIAYTGNTNQANDNTITPAVCSSSLCSVVIKNLGVNTTFMMRIESIYQASSNVTVTLNNGNASVPTTNSEVVVDATGVANGVLRRINVVLPVAPTGLISGFALQSNGDVCKRFSVTPGYFSVGNIPNADPDNAMCTIQSSGTPGT